jgi:hypothetical protein
VGRVRGGGSARLTGPAPVQHADDQLEQHRHDLTGNTNGPCVSPRTARQRNAQRQPRVSARERHRTGPVAVDVVSKLHGAGGRPLGPLTLSAGPASALRLTSVLPYHTA